MTCTSTPIYAARKLGPLLEKMKWLVFVRMPVVDMRLATIPDRGNHVHVLDRRVGPVDDVVFVVARDVCQLFFLYPRTSPSTPLGTDAACPPYETRLRVAATAEPGFGRRGFRAPSRKTACPPYETTAGGDPAFFEK